MLMYGILSHLPLTALFLIFLAGFLTLGYLGSPLIVWTITSLAVMWLVGVPLTLLAITAAVFVIFLVKPLRQLLYSNIVMAILQRLGLLPEISETEQTALKAGSVWADGELFSGKPDFDWLMNESYSELTSDEQAFIDGPCEKLCQLVDNYQTYQNGDLSPEVWDFIKKEKFFGMIVPTEYGGLGFSALAHSEVINKLSTRSVPLAITIMVPNSLGPAELINHYGTEEQKNKYLPRLAVGQEIPCFGLTEAGAASDAGGMQSSAIVFKDDKGNICLRINWSKRYITLGAIATILGVAVKVEDPDNILGKGKKPGITCVLVPASTPGVRLGRRHDPLGVPFFNSPIDGEDVVVSIDQVIGGAKGVGSGWKMLMECLSAGRSISLPANAAGGAKYVTKVVSAYASVREQFGMPIGKFEGVDEVLAKIGAFTYLLEASRIYTVGAVDKGLKPAVISAIVKYNTTEISRKLINHAMDITGGAGISKGPRNLLANLYEAAPIAITVEGANILTRSMIIFGQGALRCHPYAYKEVDALQSGDKSAFDSAFTAHTGFIVRNICRTIVLSMTRGFFVKAPSGPTSQYFKKLAWSSAVFATMTELAMILLGGSLKFKEKLTGRFADILSWMYLVTTVLRRFEAEGRPVSHEPFVHYVAQYGFEQIQKAFDGLFLNFDVPVFGPLFKYPIAFWSRLNSISVGPDDITGSQIAAAMMKSGGMRDALTERGFYMPQDPSEALARLEHAFKLAQESRLILRKIARGIKSGKITKGKPAMRTEEALEKGVIDQKEMEILKLAKEASIDTVKVDDFTVEQYKQDGSNEAKKSVG